MRKNLGIQILAACVLLGAAACAGGSASKGEARVVVLPIAGSTAANGAVTDVVSSRYELVSPKRYAKTARKLDAKSQDEKDIRKVSRKLDIDALVHGEFVKRGKRKYELRLSLRAGASGEEFESVTIKLRSKKLSSKDRSKIQNRLVEALSEVDDWADEQDSESSDAADRPSRSRRNKSGSSDDERERARKLREKKQEKEQRDEEKRLSREEKKAAEKADKADKKAAKKAAKEAEKREREREEEKAAKSAEDKALKKAQEKAEKKARKAQEKADKEAAEKAAKKAAKEAERDRKRASTVRDDDGQAIDNESPF